MTDRSELRSLLRAQPLDSVVHLAGYDPDATPLAPSKDEAKEELAGDLRDELFAWHERLFAEKERSVLLVLQGVDASGKNGTIKHVAIAMNPAGVRTSSFTEPTEEELEQHFLERYRESLPGPGELGVFDRSYYEDAIVPTVTAELDDEEIQARIDEINQFETELVESGTVVVKCLLHISFDEQRERFLRRLRRDDKRWKFSTADMESRGRWAELQAAYGSVAGRTASEHAPWYVIPADHKWYRNWAIAHLLISTLETMSPTYPQPDLDLDDLRARLAAPN